MTENIENSENESNLRLSKKQQRALNKSEKEKSDTIISYSDIDYELITNKENILIASKLTEPLNLKFLDIGKVKKVISTKNAFEIFEFKIKDLDSNTDCILNVSSSRLMNLIKKYVMEKILLKKEFVLIRHVDKFKPTATWYELVPKPTTNK